MNKWCFLVLTTLAFPCYVTALEPVEDSELSDISGRSGIALDFELEWNYDSEIVDSLTTPQNEMALCSADPLSNTECRLALNFNNREGEWAVLKGVYGVLKLNNVYVDAAQPNDTSGYQDFDRFKDGDGNCLLSQGCTVAGINSLNAMQLSFGSGGAPTLDDKDIEFGFTITSIGVEYGETGYLDNDNTGFAGVKFGDVGAGSDFAVYGNSPATADVDGRIYVSGF